MKHFVVGRNLTVALSRSWSLVYLIKYISKAVKDFAGETKVMDLKAELSCIIHLGQSSNWSPCKWESLYSQRCSRTRMRRYISQRWEDQKGINLLLLALQMEMRLYAIECKWPQKAENDTKWQEMRTWTLQL